MKPKKINLFLVSFFLLTAILHSCKGTKYAKEVAGLDSLQMVLAKADSALKSIDTVKTNTYYIELKNNLSYIQNNYKDTMERELAIFLSDYRSVKKPLEIFNSERNQLIKDLEYSQEQIKNLIHDLKNNSIEENKVMEYYTMETEAANNIITSVNVMVDMVNEQVLQFEQRNSRVQEVVNELKQKAIVKSE